MSFLSFYNMYLTDVASEKANAKPVPKQGLRQY